MEFNRIGKLAACSPLVFVAVVLYLQRVQPGHDPVHGYISELAQGEAGWLMLIGYAGLWGSLVALAIGLARSGAERAYIVLLLAGAVGVFTAAIVRLDTNLIAHVLLGIGSFLVITLAMVLLPKASERFNGRSHKIISWGLAIVMVASLSLGNGMIPAGVSQRLSALCQVAWLIWAGLQLANGNGGARR